MAEFEDFVKLELPLRPIVVDNGAEETVLVRRGDPKNYVVVDIGEGEVLGKKNGIIQGIVVSSSVGSDNMFLDLGTYNTPSFLLDLGGFGDVESAVLDGGVF